MTGALFLGLAQRVDAAQFQRLMTMHYRAPLWLPSGHAQTIWSALYARRVQGEMPVFTRERWTAPDDDFVDVDWLGNAPEQTRPEANQRPLLVLFHGLEGSSQSQYALAFAEFAREQGMDYAVPHFRGCSGELNLAPRAYHSGDWQEINWILRRFRAQRSGPIVVVGISLGGNALLRWAEELGDEAQRVVNALAAVCSPLDLAAGGHAIGRGFSRLVYTRMFLNSMKPKAFAKLAQHPGLFKREAMEQARDLYEFDNIFTAPLHGFRNTDDYWARASAKPHLARIRVPTLALNARNDPFVPAKSLPQPHQVGPCVTLWHPAQGGHVGFTAGAWPPGHVQTMPSAVGHWLMKAAAITMPAHG